MLMKTLDLVTRYEFVISENGTPTTEIFYFPGSLDLTLLSRLFEEHDPTTTSIEQGYLNARKRIRGEHDDGIPVYVYVLQGRQTVIAAKKLESSDRTPIQTYWHSCNKNQNI